LPETDEVFSEPVPDVDADVEQLDPEELPDVPDLPPEPEPLPEPLPELEPELPPEPDIDPEPEPAPDTELEPAAHDDSTDEAEESPDLVAAIDDAFEDLPDMPAFEADTAVIDSTPKPDLEAIAKQAITNLPRAKTDLSKPSDVPDLSDVPDVPDLPDPVSPLTAPAAAASVGFDDLEDDLPPIPDVENIGKANFDEPLDLDDDIEYDLADDDLSADESLDPEEDHTTAPAEELDSLEADADLKPDTTDKPSAVSTIFGGLRGWFGQLKALELICLLVIAVACIGGIFLFKHWEKLGTPPREVAPQPAEEMPKNLDGEIVKTSSLRAYWRNPTEKEADKMGEFQLVLSGPAPREGMKEEDIKKEVAKAKAQREARIAGQFIPEIEMTLEGSASGNVVVSFYNPDGDLVDTASARIDGGKFVDGDQRSATTTFACILDGFATEFVLAQYQEERDLLWYVKIRESRDNKEFNDVAFFYFPGDSQ